MVGGAWWGIFACKYFVLALRKGCWRISNPPPFLSFSQPNYEQLEREVEKKKLLLDEAKLKAKGLNPNSTPALTGAEGFSPASKPCEWPNLCPPLRACLHMCTFLETTAFYLRLHISICTLAGVLKNDCDAALLQPHSFLCNKMWKWIKYSVHIFCKLSTVSHYCNYMEDSGLLYFVLRTNTNLTRFHITSSHIIVLSPNWRSF